MKPKILVYLALVVIAVLIYFWRQDVEYKKCYQNALKYPNGGVNTSIFGHSSERCKIILNK